MLIGASGAAVGYLTANGQPRLLDLSAADRRRWVLAGIVGWMAGLPMALAVTVLFGRFETSPPATSVPNSALSMVVSIAGLVLSSEFGGLCAGLLTGIGQWRVLRRLGARAAWWIVAATLAAGLGWWITRSLSWGGQWVEGHIVGGLVYGAVSGVAIVWLLGRGDVSMRAPVVQVSRVGD